MTPRELLISKRKIEKLKALVTLDRDLEEVRDDTTLAENPKEDLKLRELKECHEVTKLEVPPIPEARLQETLERYRTITDTLEEPDTGALDTVEKKKCGWEPTVKKDDNVEICFK